MTVSRRNMLKGALVAAGTLPLFGCEKITSDAAKWLGQDIPTTSKVSSGERINDDFHLLSRATYGIWPGDLNHLKTMGRDAWLNEQLHPEQIDDRACDLRAQRLKHYGWMPAPVLNTKRKYCARSWCDTCWCVPFIASVNSMK